MTDVADKRPALPPTCSTARQLKAAGRAAQPSSSSITGPAWGAGGVRTTDRPPRRRVEAALSGTLPPLADLSEEEGVVFNAEISAAIEEKLVRSDYGAALAARGITTVAIDEDGQLVEYHPTAPPWRWARRPDLSGGETSRPRRRPPQRSG